MKLVQYTKRNANFPHLIIRADNRNWRWAIGVSNTPIAFGPSVLFDVVGLGCADNYGNITEAGRKIVLARVIDRAKATGEFVCIVWSNNDCTYITADGLERAGTRPPRGELMVADDEAHRAPLMIQSVAYVTLPPGSEQSHLCLEQCGDLVHICAGAPLIVADFREEPVGGLSDPTLSLRARDGSWPSAFIYRGVSIERIEDDRVLIGPVQPLPNAPSLTLRDPWPDQLEEACRDLAGRALPRQVLQAAWRALHPEDPGLVRADVREAA